MTFAAEGRREEDSSSRKGGYESSEQTSRLPSSLTFWAPCEPNRWIAVEGQRVRIENIPLVVHRHLSGLGFMVSDPACGGAILNESCISAGDAIHLARQVLAIKGVAGFRQAQKMVRNKASQNLGPKPDEEPVAGLVVERVNA